jgi:4-hydroxy-3-methylbut-2-enyl diphosphate reductase
VGGHHSNNTSQLVHKARALGATAYHIATPNELDPAWFRRTKTVGITAGTSTLDETVRQVFDRIQQIAASQSRHPFRKIVATH